MNAEATAHDAHGTAPADTMADRHVAAYDSRPWRRHAPDAPDLAAPRLPHLAALVREVAQTYAAQTAFTTCMPNGMHA